MAQANSQLLVQTTTMPASTTPAGPVVVYQPNMLEDALRQMLRRLENICSGMDDLRREMGDLCSRMNNRNRRMDNGRMDNISGHLDNTSSHMDSNVDSTSSRLETTVELLKGMSLENVRISISIAPRNKYTHLWVWLFCS